MKKLNDSSDVPEARLGILLKTYTSSKKKTRLHSTFPRRNGYSRLRNLKDPEEREFVVDSGASMHMVSKKDLNSAELETMRTSKSDDGDDGQRRRANKRRSHRKCHTIGPIRQSCAS